MRRSQSSSSQRYESGGPAQDNTNYPDPNDFCNAFWTPQGTTDDSGVDVVLARVKAGSKTLEDLKNFYKER